MKNKLLSFLSSVFCRKRGRNTGREQDLEATDYIQHRLDLYMVEKRPFLQPRLTLKQLAAAIHIPSYQLSVIINQRKGMNFSDYINKQRIHYCEDRIRIEKGKKIDIQQLASRCGFRNRTTFVRAFRKFTGLSPSDHISVNTRKCKMPILTNFGRMDRNYFAVLHTGRIFSSGVLFMLSR